MIELIVLAVVVTIVLSVLGLVATVLSFAFWLILLPFKLLGLLLKGLAFLAALPFLLLFGVIALCVGGLGALVLLGPLLPFVLVVALVIWLVRGDRAGSKARVTG